MRSLPVREAPAPEALHRWLDDPSRPHVPCEPLLDIDEVQGNILGGFMKDYQLLLCVRITDPRAFGAWLASQIPFIASSAEVLAFNRLYKAMRHRRKRVNPADDDAIGDPEPPSIKATWVNIAFSYAGLQKLTAGTDLLTGRNDFLDTAFKQGLAQRSPELGDPTDADHPGAAVNWPIGGTQTEVDAIIIVASDELGDLGSEVDRLVRMLNRSGSAEVVFPNIPTGRSVRDALLDGRDAPEYGSNLPGDLGGHEHFGFLDGVSQPGLRGRISDDPRDVLTLRQNPLDREQGKPGQDLLWPGEFVFGYPDQDPKPASEKADLDAAREKPPAVPRPDATAGPAWAENGSFLVFRRLRQDVRAFHHFLKHEADARGVAPGWLGARLVGRWQSGAPVLRTPDEDCPALGDNDCANNHFEFGEPSEEIPPSGDPQSADCVDVDLPRSQGDPQGLICPFAGHIRKVYPRDDKSVDQSVDGDDQCARARPDLREDTTQTHRLLRRGIPFGPPSPSTLDAPAEDGQPRGLYFLAYQTSIEEQFEFVTRCWVNNPSFKEPGAGHDPIIGQNGAPGEGRVRRFTVRIGSEESSAEEVLTTADEWVIPAGGGYFFAPSMSALQMLASAPSSGSGAYRVESSTTRRERPMVSGPNLKECLMKSGASEDEAKEAVASWALGQFIYEQNPYGDGLAVTGTLALGETKSLSRSTTGRPCLKEYIATNQAREDRGELVQVDGHAWFHDEHNAVTFKDIRDVEVKDDKGKVGLLDKIMDSLFWTFRGKPLRVIKALAIPYTYKGMRDDQKTYLVIGFHGQGCD